MSAPEPVQQHQEAGRRQDHGHGRRHGDDQPAPASPDVEVQPSFPSPHHGEIPWFGSPVQGADWTQGSACLTPVARLEQLFGSTEGRG